MISMLHIPWIMLLQNLEPSVAGINVAKVSASHCKKFAESAVDQIAPHLSAAGAKSLRSAANAKCIKNAERDLLALFRHESLTLPIESMMVPGLINVHYLSLRTWIPFLMKHYPSLLLGGFGRTDWFAKLLLTTFWKNFQIGFGNHEFFNIHGPDDFHRCLPFYFHLDEGVGLKKGAVLVLAWQCVFGRETAKRFASYRNITNDELRMTEAQMHNAKGSTYLTRFLFTALPKKTYGGKRNPTYYKVLEVIAEECKDLMVNGLEICGEVWYPCCLGFKGDQPALIKSGKFKRSYMNLSVNKGCCWECLAGFNEFPFEEVALSPKWEATIGLVEPWDPQDPSPLVAIPGFTGNLHQFWWRDAFHAYKQTIGGHYTASLIVLLAVDFGVWKDPSLSNAVDEVLERAFSDFRFWVRHEWRGKVTNHISAFTRAILHFSDQMKFPFARFKGSDQMLITRWLRHVILNGVYLEGDVVRCRGSLINNPPEPWQSSCFSAAVRGCEGAINFFHSLHNGGVWLAKGCGNTMALDCYKFCSAYKGLAVLCHQKALARFHLEPSLHVMMHFYTDLSKPHEIHLNPAIATCEMDEDFIGKICRSCRHVHASSMTRRCIDRYLIKCHFEFLKM